MPTTTLDLSTATLIDLTHALSPDIPHWEAGCGFNHTTVHDYEDSTGDVKFRVQKIESYCGIGTHMDAPAHCIPDARTIADIPLKNLITPCVMIDVADKAGEHYLVSCDDIIQFESTHGRINKDTLVIFHTGWSQYWNEPQKYRNDLVFPTLSNPAAELLLERQVTGMGIDTLSPDSPTSGFPVHKTLLGADKFIIENVANAHLLPPVGAYILALPLKIQNGTEAPIRLVGIAG
ncbi:MAG: cyclase [Coxiella sp. (in: Bacteria)]|nr:MAG: cyclase [Coxiella sp. (in: g-proteobacteria)]